MKQQFQIIETTDENKFYNKTNITMHLCSSMCKITCSGYNWFKYIS
ncbi:hypothetical protein KL86DYS1_10804 [uncultured Dysgonomonas sp.]|uniref:Uncharacterized protein n=1 Tax=uncultured Dysgonomonas sp. TaxID=206096 RepID=A0A212J1B0_9BACT|nr:hypothetical protein KL86DYS1_10804 [uncultured Dysgonomonas sp.]